MPTDCGQSGFWVRFITYDGKDFWLEVGQQENGEVTTASIKATKLKVAPPVAAAPDRIDLFFSGEKTEIGIAIRTGSAMELVPAGADKAYAATSLYLMRCG